MRSLWNGCTDGGWDSWHKSWDHFYIPGIRPGEPTMIYIDKVMSRITLAGALFLAFIAILPNFIGNITGIQGVYFGGTSLLIVVGVALDTMRQAQSLMVTRNYQGFIK